MSRPGFPIPDGLLGREVDLGTVTVSVDMIAAYAQAVGDAEILAGPLREAPPTFCLSLRVGMTPEIPLPADMFGVYGGHDLEFHSPIRAGETYHVRARIEDVYEKSGRSGALTMIVRKATICDGTGMVVARITERQVVRRRPATTAV
jgi:N-terminal half of MaoC dehydratase